MTWWRILLILLYTVGSYFLDRLVSEKFTSISKGYVPEIIRPWIAIFLLWGSTLWFIPGLLWIGILPAKLHIIIVMSFLTPLAVHVVYMLRKGLFPSRPPVFLMFNVVVFIVFIAIWGLEFVLTTPWEGMNKILYVGFFLTLIIPAVIANELFKNTLPQMIPNRIDDLDGVDLMEKMVLGYYTTIPKPVWFIDNGKIEKRIKGNAFLGSGVSLLTTEPENLVGRKAGPNFAGINEPGTTLVAGGTVPSAVIDLRNQIRIDKVDCITRDGINVKVPISSLFRIDWGTREPEFGKRWPYSKPGATQACVADLVDPAGKTPLEEQASHKWDDLPLYHARRALRRAIRYYTLDQLYGPSKAEIEAAAKTRSMPTRLVNLKEIHNRVSLDLLGKEYDHDDSTPLPLTRLVIGKFVQSHVRNALAPSHYTISGGGIGNAIEPANPMVTVQRIEAWKSKMEQRILAWQGKIHDSRYSKSLKMQEDALRQYLDSLLSEESVEKLAEFDSMKVRKLLFLRQLFQLGSRQEAESLLDDDAYPSLEWLKPNNKEEGES